MPDLAHLFEQLQRLFRFLRLDVRHHGGIVIHRVSLDAERLLRREDVQRRVEAFPSIQSRDERRERPRVRAQRSRIIVRAQTVLL